MADLEQVLLARDALCAVTGFPLEGIQSALFPCRRYGVDFTEATKQFKFIPSLGPEDNRVGLIQEIGEYVADLACQQFCEATSVEEFFECTGADADQFWIECTDSHKATLRELFSENPHVMDSLPQPAQTLVGEMCTCCDISVSYSSQKGASR